MMDVHTERQKDRQTDSVTREKTLPPAQDSRTSGEYDSINKIDLCETNTQGLDNTDRRKRWCGSGIGQQYPCHACTLIPSTYEGQTQIFTNGCTDTNFLVRPIRCTPPLWGCSSKITYSPFLDDYFTRAIRAKPLFRGETHK